MQRRQVFLQATIAGFLAAVLLAGSLLALPAGAATSEAEGAVEERPGRPAAPEVPVYADWVEDSGLPSTIRSLFWVEDSRVLFSRLRLDDPSNPRAWGNLGSSLVIWTPGTPGAEAEIYAEDYGGDLCYADGRIRYHLEDRVDGYYPVVAGPLGEESLEVATDRPRGSRLNEFNCRFEPWPERWAGRYTMDALQPGHGWLDWHRESGRAPVAVIHFPTADHPGIALDLESRDVYRHCLRWIAWRQVYFTDVCGQGRALDHRIASGVWLWPDGRVEVPDLPTPGLFHWMWPTPAGLLVSVDRNDPSGNLNHSGVYLWREGEFRLLIPGIVYDGAVTSDGCRAAISHTPTFGAILLRTPDWRLKTMKIIDLCGYLDRILEEAPVIDAETLLRWPPVPVH